MNVVIQGPTFRLSSLATLKLHKQASRAHRRLFHVTPTAKRRFVAESSRMLQDMTLHQAKHFELIKFLCGKLGVKPSTTVQVMLVLDDVNAATGSWSEVRWIVTLDKSTDTLYEFKDLVLTRAQGWLWNRQISLAAWLSEQPSESSSTNELIVRLPEATTLGILVEFVGALVVECLPALKQAIETAPKEDFVIQ